MSEIVFLHLNSIGTENKAQNVFHLWHTQSKQNAYE